MKTAKPKMIGSINCRILTEAKSGRKTFFFDGTTLGLTIAALKAGIKIGAKITQSGYTYVMTSAPHDSRANGFWASQVW